MKPINLPAMKLLTLILIFGVVAAAQGKSPAFPTDSRIIHDACFSKYGQVLFVADNAGIKAFCFNTRNLLREFAGAHQSPVMALSVAADSSMLVSADRDGLLVAHYMESGNVLHHFPNRQGIILSTDISPDGRYLAAGGTDHLVGLYDLAGMKAIDHFRVHTDDVTGVKFSPDGRWLVSVGADGRTTIFDVEHKKLQHQSEGRGTFLRDLNFAPDGQSFVTVGDGGHYYTWNITEQGNVRMIPSGRVARHWITGISHASQSRVFAIATVRGHIRMIMPFGSLSANVRVPVNKVLLRPRDDQRVEIIAATRGKGIVFIDGRDMKP
jgi:WD40 repeat protein